MPDKVLFVDDDQNLLDAYRRQLEFLFDVHTAAGGQAGLETMQNAGPFPVVIADMRMPGMDGIHFLQKVQERDPLTVRIMLTGNADLQTAINAINEGRIFRFLTKPCSPEVLERAVDMGIRQYKLESSEQELLSKTLVGAVSVMTEILSMTNPIAFRRATRIRRLMEVIVRDMNLEDGWRYELAAMLSQIGWVCFPPDLMRRIASGTEMTKEEERIIAMGPVIGRRMLEKIPRMSLIARMIEGQARSAAELKFDSVQGDDYIVAIGSNALHICLDYDMLAQNGMIHSTCINTLFKRQQMYHPDFLRALAKMPVESEKGYEEINLEDVEPGMVLIEGVWDFKGNLLVPKDTEVTFPLLMQLFSMNMKSGFIAEPVRVRRPNKDFWSTPVMEKNG